MAEALKLWTLPFLVLLLLTKLTRRVDSESVQDKQALLAFLAATQRMTPNSLFQWNESISVCTWRGVQCDRNRSFVSVVNLPSSGLSRSIPVNSLGRLRNLRVLNLQSNSLSGELPFDFSNLRHLKVLDLGNNRFSRVFPASVTLLTELTRIDLSSNWFSGPIPAMIGNLTKVLMQYNFFYGIVPALMLPELQDFNVSYNNMTGTIPETLSSFPASAFLGNPSLCGPPVKSCT